MSVMLFAKNESFEFFGSGKCKRRSYTVNAIIIDIFIAGDYKMQTPIQKAIPFIRSAIFMKKERFTILQIIISISFGLFGCISAKPDGTFMPQRSPLGGAMFNFNNTSKEFEYYSYGEWGIQQYSKGDYMTKGNKIYLYGFNDKNLNLLKWKFSTAKDSSNYSKLKIRINYRKLQTNNMIKNILVIDDKELIKLNADTTLSFPHYPNSLQVKSFMSYTGLLANTPSIDTIQTSKMAINSGNINYNIINLFITIDGNDFSRIKLKDTLSMKRHNILRRKIFNTQIRFYKQTGDQLDN